MAGQQTENGQAVEGLDLVQLLTEPCPFCPAVHEAVRRLCGAMQRAPVKAEVTVRSAQGYTDVAGVLRDNLSVQCESCHGTGRVPTAAGNQLLWFLKWFADPVTCEKQPTFPPPPVADPPVPF